MPEALPYRGGIQPGETQHSWFFMGKHLFLRGETFGDHGGINGNIFLDTEIL